MTYYVDIDNTICRTKGMDYANAKPIRKHIDKMNGLYNLGFDVVYYTSRGVGSGVDYRELTERQLKNWGVKYTELRLDKPVFDVFIDDRAVSAEEFFNEI